MQRRGLRLYFRLTIPKDVQRWFGGKVEVKRSLKTTRYTLAKALVAAETAKAERLFAQIRGGLMTNEEIRRLVSAYFERTLAEAEDARADGLGVLKDEREDGTSSLTGLELHLEGLMEDLARGETRGVAHFADTILEEAGITLEKDSQEYRKLCREALKSAVTATRIELERMSGDYRGKVGSTPRSGLTVSPPAAPAKPSVRLTEAIAEFVAEHDASGHWRPKSRKESEGIYRLLVGILGDVPMSELDYKALSRWRDALLRFPSNYTKRPALRGKTISEIAALSLETEIDDPLSPTSVNKMLTQTGAFLKWGVKRGYCGANYCEGLTIKRRGTKPEEEREAYSKEDLLRLVRSPLYAEPKTAKEQRDRIAHPERQWLPLLGLYTAARINELCQLQVADVQNVDGGILCLDINDKGEGKRLKNASSRRVIPVHPFLLELGFGKYVEELRKRGVKQLWPALKLKRDGWAQDYGKLYQRFNRKFVTTDEKRVFHSFRHCVADTLKQREVDGNLITELLGHSLGGSMSLGRYGKAYRPAVLLEALKKLEYGIEEELRRLPRLG